MTYLTTADAADRLGVTPRRVRQMLLAGQLRGQRHGRDWLIPEDSLTTIARPKRGRPRRNTMRERMTPGQAWDQFVGEQTPEEFMAESRVRGYQTVERAVWAYVGEQVDLGQITPGDWPEGGAIEVCESLIEYIRQQTSAATLDNATLGEARPS